MSCALVIFENPNANQLKEWQQWKNILTNLENTAKKNDQIQKIHENVWLFALQNGLLPFVHALADSDNKNIKYRVLFFEEYPNFSPPIN